MNSRAQICACRQILSQSSAARFRQAIITDSNVRESSRGSAKMIALSLSMSLIALKVESSITVV